MLIYFNKKKIEKIRWQTYWSADKVTYTIITEYVGGAQKTKTFKGEHNKSKAQFYCALMETKKKYQK